MLMLHKQKGSQPRNRENEQLIEDLYKRNTELQRENGELKSKNKSLIEALAKEKKKVTAVSVTLTCSNVCST
jgi:cell division septum initiation protein DivIVA